MLAEQVVQLVAAGCGLGEQVLVIQLIEQAAGLIQAGAIQGGGGVGVEVRAGDQAKAPGPPRVFRTAKLSLFHAASCRFRYSSRASCGVRYPSAE